MTNDLYNERELIRGRWYQYDPDFDVWRPVAVETDTHPVLAAVVTLVILAAITVYVVYFR